MKYIHRIVIGDWSHDGHNQEDFFNFECTHDEKEIKNAYKNAVNKCKVALHIHSRHSSDITAVCCNYQEHTINAPEIKALRKLGVNFKFTQNIKDDCCPKDIANIFFEMVKTQILGFEYKILEQKTINGFWSKDFNFTFGYGCY